MFNTYATAKRTGTHQLLSVTGITFQLTFCIRSMFLFMYLENPYTTSPAQRLSRGRDVKQRQHSLLFQASETRPGRYSSGRRTLAAAGRPRVASGQYRVTWHWHHVTGWHVLVSFHGTASTTQCCYAEEAIEMNCALDINHADVSVYWDARVDFLFLWWTVQLSTSFYVL